MKYGWLALVAAALLALVVVFGGRSGPRLPAGPEPAGIVSEPPGEQAPLARPAREPLAPDLGEAPADPAPLASLGEPERAEPEPIPLQNLLRLQPQDPRAPLGLEVDRNLHLREPRAEANGGAPRPSLAERVSVEHRSQQAGVPGPRETTVGQTDARVSVPVKESVDLRGGVRLDSRRTGDGELEDLEAAPSVGVDVRF